MKRFMLSLGVAAMMSTSLVHANFFENALKVAQTMQGGNNANAQQAASQSQNKAPVDATPLSTYDLKYMDCAELAVHSAGAQREIKNLRGQAEQFDKLAAQADQEAAAAGNTKMLGGLMSLAGGLMGDKDRNTSNTLNTLGKNFSTTQSEAALQGMDPEGIVALYKKHEVDLENIKIYQKAKKCN